MCVGEVTAEALGTQVAKDICAMILPRCSARSLATSASVAAIAIALTASLLGCEGDSFGYSTRKLPAYKTDSSGGNTPTQQNNDPAPSSSDPPGTGSQPDQQNPPAQTDAGAGVDASKPPPAAPGACGTPKCFAIGGVCGCKATDSAGNTVKMGCQDGACACFDANGNDTNDFDSSCDDPASAAIAFQQCACN